MNVDPIHIGQVALANSLLLSAHRTARNTGPGLRRRLAQWLNALIPTHR